MTAWWGHLPNPEGSRHALCAVSRDGLYFHARCACMQRERPMSCRTPVLPEQPGRAVGCPHTGPGFTSTSLWVAKFQAAADEARRKLLGAVGATAGKELEDLDIDASSLRLASLTEIASQTLRREREAAVEEGATALPTARAKTGRKGKSQREAGLAEGRSTRGRGERRGSRRGVDGAGGQRKRNLDSEEDSEEPSECTSWQTDGLSIDMRPRVNGYADEKRGDSGAMHSRPGQGWLQHLEEDPSISSVPSDRWTASPSPSNRWDVSLSETLESAPGHDRDCCESQAPVRRARSRAARQCSKPDAHRFPKFDGDLKDVMEEHRTAFYTSGQDLESVRQAVKLFLLHATPFSSTSRVTVKSNAYLPRPDEPQLSSDEVVLRIEVREFELMHFTMQEFLVLGSQSMAELRDKISCPADRNLEAVKRGIKGGYFYIEGTFYLDAQGNRAVQDYPLPITEFCLANNIVAPSEVPSHASEALPQAKKSGIDGSGGSGAEKFRKGDMRQTRWDEIGTRTGPGAGYIYCHQGCCEHLLVIKDVRCLHPDDPQYAGAYPVCLQEEAFNRRRCDVCQLVMAAHVTYEDRHAPAEPAFWCPDCYRMMHYDRNSKLLYEHKVFPYQCG